MSKRNQAARDDRTTLPSFDGLEVETARYAFSGAVDDPPQVLHVDEPITLVVKGRVVAVNHKVNQFGHVKRVHSVKVVHAMAADEATVRQLEQAIKQAEDEAAGQTSLDAELDAELEADNDGR